MQSKKGEFNMSFGMIFSIFLIVIFLAFGFYAIKTFVKMQAEAQFNFFISDLQKDINATWQSGEERDWPVSYSVPTYIKGVCFEEGDFNLKIVSDESISNKRLYHLDITKMLTTENPFCIDKVDRRISLVLSLGQGETLITIKK